MYRTATGSDRNITFTVPAGVKLYGGFRGKERGLGQRPARTYATLTGDLGTKGQPEDNAYTVVTLLSANGRASTLDGFHVTGGNGRTYSDGATPGQAGGGLYIKAATGRAAGHQITNCHFVANAAHNGGAAYVNGGRATFTDCSFRSNNADFNGGAVYLNGNKQAARPIFRNCLFTDNASNSGGGITNYGGKGEASPTLISCDFVDNVSLINGAAIFNITGAGGACAPKLTDCKFNGNASILNADVAGVRVEKGRAKNRLTPKGSQARLAIARR